MLIIFFFSRSIFIKVSILLQFPTKKFWMKLNAGILRKRIFLHNNGVICMDHWEVQSGILKPPVVNFYRSRAFQG